jgi:monovalent cation/hydrogen antiporter
LTFLFILVGLDFPTILRDLVGPALATDVGYAAVLSLTVIVFRLLWVLVMSYAPLLTSLPPKRRPRAPNWRNAVVMGWAGTRGAISLAAALALPLAFPGRSLIIFLTFGVIFSTLVLQGLSLPALLRWLRLADDGKIDSEESVARAASAEAALRVLTDPAVTDAYPAAIVDDLRTHYTLDLGRASRANDERRDPDVTPSANSPNPGQRLRLALIAAEREAIIHLRDRGEIGNEALRQVEENLDLEELQLT